MRCEECDRAATFHAVIGLGSTWREVHLCEDCRQTRLQVGKDGDPAVLANLLIEEADAMDPALARLRCPDCGIAFMDFRKAGMLGCPNDYVVFRAGMLPLLDRVHAAKHHTGKRPKASPQPIEAFGPLRQLRRQLREAVASEDYATAAKVRNLIRAKERNHAAGLGP